MNNVQLMGRLTRDAELRYLQGQANTAVVRFNLAVDKNLSRDKKQEMETKGQPTADFISCQAWGKLAENISKYSGKGLRLLILGRIQTGSYKHDDGHTVYTTDVIVSSAEFIDWKTNNNTQSQASNSWAQDDNFEYSADFDPTQDNRIPF